MNPTLPGDGDSDSLPPTAADPPRAVAMPIITDPAVLEKFLVALQPRDTHTDPHRPPIPNTPPR